MNYQPIPLAEWLPDFDAYANPGATVATNVIPVANGYLPARALSPQSDALAAAPVGAVSMRDSGGNFYNFAGTATALYQLGAGSWSDVSQGGGYTSIDRWEFTQFGDRLIAWAYAQVPQYIDLPAGPAFADLPGSPPAAKHAGVCRDFLLAGHDDVNPRTLHWSGYNASEVWGFNATAMSDSQDFLEGGAITRITSGDRALVFQEDMIRLATPVGPPLFFSIDIVSRDLGAPISGAVAWRGQHVYWYSDSGFMMWDGQRIAPIGDQKVDRWFYRNMDWSRPELVRSVVDRRNERVLFAFPDLSAGSAANKVLLFDRPTQRWSLLSMEVAELVEYVTQGYTLDELDIPFPDGPDAPGQDIIVDSDIFQGGTLSAAGFSAAWELGPFAGDVLPATVETAEVGGPGRQFVRAVRPLVDGGTVTVQIGSRNRQQDTINWTQPKAVNTAGRAPFRNNARYRRVRLNITGNFARAAGVEPEYRKTGGGDR